MKELADEWERMNVQERDSKFITLRKLLDYLSEDTLDEAFKAIIFSCFITTRGYLEQQLKEDYHIYKMTGQTDVRRVIEYLG